MEHLLPAREDCTARSAVIACLQNHIHVALGITEKEPLDSAPVGLRARAQINSELVLSLVPGV